MRLASKIFLASSLVIVVLAVVGILSLRAVGRLVSVNQEITTHTLPTVRLTGAVRDAMLSLARLEARYGVFRDPRYATLWRDGADRAREDLARLASLVRTDAEQTYVREATAAFDRYRAAVLDEQGPLGPASGRGAGPAAGPGPRALAERVEASLEGLMEATSARVVRAQAEAERLASRTWTGVLLALGAALAVALAGTGLIAWRMTRSLRRLSAATSAVAAGSFREPIPVGGRDEIGALARSFNAMAAELRQMEETKDEFFATLSHELRSPLTSVREAALLLREEVPGALNPRQARLVQLVGQSTDRLLRLVNQILEMSRLRAGVLPVERAPVDLARLVGRAVDELRPQADEAGVAIELERVGDRFGVTGDEDRLTQVVVNLVANAVRFTPRAGRVAVRLIDAGREIEIQVEDTGVGISAAALPHIFDSYRQAHRGHGGTGLGLAIVRGVVHAHGGRVTVESQEGKGSRFTVLLPRPGALA